jgi:hypothetical protein
VKGGVQQQTERGEIVETNENPGSSSERYISMSCQLVTFRNLYFSLKIVVQQTCQMIRERTQTMK